MTTLLDHMVGFNDYFKTSKLSELNEDQSNLPKLVIPECLQHLSYSVTQYRNKFGAVIREFESTDGLNEEQQLAVLSIMFG